MRIRHFLIPAIMVFVAAVASGFPVPVSPGKPIKDIWPLEQKLHGTWKGHGCDGTLVFDSDGTYRRSHYGPGNHSNSGTWEIRWDALPPTLVLHCKKSRLDEEVGKDYEYKIIKLDDSAFSYTYLNEQSPPRYQREMK